MVWCFFGCLIGIVVLPRALVWWLERRRIRRLERERLERESELRRIGLLCGFRPGRELDRFVHYELQQRGRSRWN